MTLDLIVSLKHLKPPRYALPSRKYFSDSIVPDIKDKINEKLAEMLVDVLYLSLTTDIWSSSSAQVSLISLTAHWLHKILIECQLYSTHTDVKGLILVSTYVKS